MFVMSPASDPVTPIRQQYLQIKKRYPHAIVFFRLGDFYETFDEDAQIASRELDVVLTSRNVAKGQRIPMAGVPYHAVDSYIARLIAKGYKVAICEQTGQAIDGLMPREVTRVVTPGTVVEPVLLADKRNNYLATLVIEEGEGGHRLCRHHHRRVPDHRRLRMHGSSWPRRASWTACAPRRSC